MSSNRIMPYLKSIGLYLIFSSALFFLVFAANIVAPIFDPSIRVWSYLLGSGLFSLWGLLVMGCTWGFAFVAGRVLAGGNDGPTVLSPSVVGLFIVPLSFAWVFLVAGITTPIEIIITISLTIAGLLRGFGAREVDEVDSQGT